MARSSHALDDFLRTYGSVIRIALTRVRGSSPRNEGTEMFASDQSLFGTIGGGQLEHMAIEQARDMLRDGALNRDMDVPLGPEIGQCCGGRVELSLSRMRGSDRRAAIRRAEDQIEALPHVYVMGGGHVGRALAAQFQHMPVRCILVDTRPEEIALCDANIETRISAIPEIDIVNAPAGSAFVVLTHDHGLDFLLTSAALERGDARYVGMIGSATKRERLRRDLEAAGRGGDIDRLTVPIGGAALRDKRPEVIAALTAAELATCLLSSQQEIVIDRFAAASARCNSAPVRSTR